MARRKTHRRKRRTPRIRKTAPPGAPPGSWRSPEGAAETTVTIMQLGGGTIQERPLTDLSTLRPLLSKPLVTWIHVEGLGSSSRLQKLADIFRLHPLAMEDVVNQHQRAKVDEYGEHLFIVAHLPVTGEHLFTEQLSIFLGPDYVLTFQEGKASGLGAVRDRIRRAYGTTRQIGADYLVYSILDAVIDMYFPVVDGYGERLEQLDVDLNQGRVGNFMAALHDLRGDLMLLRRATRPLRDALLRLTPDARTQIKPETQVYLRDCYDHTVQLLDLLDSYRELAFDLRDYYMSSMSNRLNEVMKVLTIISTTFIPLSFITGLYGMNFNTRLPGNMPELNWPYGYLVVLLLMLIIAIVQYSYFWRRGWLTRSDTDMFFARNSGDNERS